MLPSLCDMFPLGWKHLTIVDWIRYLTASNVHHSRDIPRDAVFSQRLPLALETRYLEWEQLQAPDYSMMRLAAYLSCS
ncbi:hypothetical protein PAXINDRAFT_19711 [Paxillus involutus ATCC 200175]|uniref:Unplaced genomic scaffold PAXINscaffold_703, whole genome shotgun sequence n=1 Tax=Paxillus involutus ATCC 200175 TaxID=664439 RepID=A0A0C9SWD7_PAXIN|nr:hypothetical protein PAXINDRAFT_19711 [Paxillus involutus ATCC 200175]